jgi:glutamate:GABA antiporter
LSRTPQSEAQTQLIRALGRRDLVLLFVVAVFNLNVVPSIAANGGVTIWLWSISLLLFFWPQGIAVIELAHRYPGEGGVYLWAKEVFGDFHGFLSGWCYWTNNMLYVPTVMLYFVGVSVYALGPGHQGLADNKLFASVASLSLLALLTLFNIWGLGVGKWINNLGAIGTFVAAGVLIGLGAVIWSHFGTSITAADFKIPANPKFVLNSFGVICFGLVGLELASVMGDEIKDPQRTLPGAVALGGVLSGALYIGATLALLVAIGKNVNVLEGIVQAVTQMAGQLGLSWITIPFAVMLSLSIAGIGSAWMGGSARIPFVAGLDSYMPAWLGKVHPRYATPHAALMVQGIVSAVLVILNFAGAGVQETFQKLLSLAVVLQLVPFVYMFGALVKFAVTEAARPIRSRGDVRGWTQRLAYDDSRHCSRVFPGAADHIALAIRIVDGRRHGLFPRSGRVFLLRLWAAQSHRGATYFRPERESQDGARNQPAPVGPKEAGGSRCSAEFKPK